MRGECKALQETAEQYASELEAVRASVAGLQSEKVLASFEVGSDHGS